MKAFLQAVARRLGFELRPISPAPKHAVFSSTMASDCDLLALRHLADRAAQFSASNEYSRVVRNLYLTGILREEAVAEISRIEIGNENTVDVGIWRKQSRSKDAPFIRMAGSDRFSWARNETIEPKRTRWRVALVGESVARGYLYDPDFTPATALEQMLRSHLGSAEIDVVDLAKSSLTIQPLKTLIGQALALRPDVIVVFAGNNWHMQLRESDLPYVDCLLRRDGVPGLKTYIDGSVKHAVRQLIEQVNTVVERKGITLIWMVPESNLDDWHDPASPAPLLPGRGNRQWRDLSEKASLALEQRDLLTAERLALSMLRLDGGTNSLTTRILAECCRSKSDSSGASRYLGMCRDAEGWNPAFAYTPRTSSVIQSALRTATSSSNNVVVDLPQIFGRYLEGHPPNRRLFIDYCHLTADGINLAMAAAAARILESLKLRPASIEQLQSRAASISGETEGRACLLAAIHNAHYYQGYELASYWSGRALRFWPGSAEIMRRFIDFQTRRGETMACKSAIELFDSRELITLTRGGKKRLDLSLIDAMVSALAAAGMGNLGRQIAELRVSEHSLMAGPKELTDFYYSSMMVRPSERGWTSKSFSTNLGSHCIYASAFWETSKFVFFAERAHPVGLRLTFRVPARHGSAVSIAVDLNGHRLAEMPAAASWQTLELSVLSDYVTDGLNEIVISWPDDDDSDNILDRAADALASRRMPRFYRIFGEIHSLLAFDPCAVSAGVGERGLAISERAGFPSRETPDLLTADSA